MELSALTQFIVNISMALDAGYDVTPSEMTAHIVRGDLIPFLTDMCCSDANLMAQLFREHWTERNERELIELLRDALMNLEVTRGIHCSGMCCLIALTAEVIQRRFGMR
jgi:hypothetical protein